jgi:hypothetical protein
MALLYAADVWQCWKLALSRPVKEQHNACGGVCNSITIPHVACDAARRQAVWQGWR